MQLTDPTSQQIQDFIDDPDEAVLDIFGNSYLQKVNYRNCVELRGGVPKVINNYGILRLQPAPIGQPYDNDTYLFGSEEPGAANFTFNGGRFDGSWNHTPDWPEQVHCFSLSNVENMHFNGLHIENFKGDGAKIAGIGPNQVLTNGVWFRDCIIRETGRDGITMYNRSRNVHIKGCIFENVADQGIDFEPSGVTSLFERPANVYISNCTIYHNTETYCLTLTYGLDVFVTDCVLYGSVQGVDVIGLRMNNVKIYGNEPVVGKGPRHSFSFARACKDIRLDNVDVVQRENMRCVEFLWNGGVRPENISWNGGSITQPFIGQTGLNAVAVEGLVMDGVIFRGPGNAIALASQQQNMDVDLVQVRNCRFENWNKGLWISRGVTNSVFFTGNYSKNVVATPYSQDVATTVNQIINQGNLSC